MTKEKRFHLNALITWRNHLYCQGDIVHVVAWHTALLLISAAIVALDAFSGQQINLFVFFVIPIQLAAWKLGLVEGLAYALLGIMGTVASHAFLAGLPLPGYAIINAFARVAVFALVVIGTWKIRVLGDAVADLSLTDPLTGLNNRRSFFLHGSFELSRSARSGEPLSVLYCDIDNFKSVNDAHGHDAGDDLLKLVGNTLKGSLRKSDTSARLGGDEFAAILPATDGAGATRLATKLRDKLNGVFASMQDAHVSASVGIATFHSPPGTFDDVVKAADSLMYEVKSKGKNDIAQRDFGQKP